MPDSPCTLLLPKTNSRRRGAKRPDLAKIKGVIASSRKKNTWRETKFGTYRNKFTHIHTLHYITLNYITYIQLYIYVIIYIYYESRSKLFIINKQKWWILLGFEKIIHNLSILAYIHTYIYKYICIYIFIINLYVIMDLDLLGSFSIPISCRYIHPDRTHSSISMAKRW